MNIGRFRLLSLVVVTSLIFTATVSAKNILPDYGLPNDEGGISLPQGNQDIDDTATIEVDHLIAKGGTVKVMVELSASPSVVTYASLIEEKGIGPAADSAIAQLDAIKQAQADLTAELTSSKIDAAVIYTAQRVYNGIAIQVDASHLKEISRLKNVKTIHPLVSKEMDNSSSVPLIGAPQTWSVGLGTRGEGITVGIIDTGIDYLHTNFGGPGTGYDDNDTLVAGDTANYPGVKVAGGYDFVGDDYDASYTSTSIPSPDYDPMDCNGHGSHVAGTVAGYGVNADGSTYDGSYGAGTAFDELTIGPGVAPDAALYALRVFGCDGSTDVVTEALDWAVDPNGDGDFSDHLDVVNMSLGSDFGTGYDADSVASDNAVLAGVIVVASAGNSYDTYYIAGSPGDATRAISVAASVDALDTWDGFQVTAPPEIAGVYYSTNSVAYDWLNEPDVTGDVVYPDTNQSGCSAFTAGTFTGKIALIDWTHDEYGNIDCGSVTRTTNAYNAGAIGVIMAEDIPDIDTAITGHSVIPSTLTTLATGDAIRAALESGTVTVRFSKDYVAAVPITDEGQVDTMTDFSSRGVRRGDNFLKPDITAPGYTILSTRALSGTFAESMNGTSMAAPHIAGVMALLRQMHPSWSVEELKALAMNTATHDLYTEDDYSGEMYSPARVGAGRVDVYNASQNNVVMYNAEDAGAVSVSFGAPQVTTTYSAAKSIIVENKGKDDVTYDVVFENRSEIPGVTFTVLDPDNVELTSLTLAAGDSTTINIQLDIDASEMTHTYDAALQNGDGPLGQWVSEASGLIKFNEQTSYDIKNPEVLRLPVFVAPRPASAMSSEGGAQFSTETDNLVNISLVGTNVDTTEIEAAPIGETSLVTALELVGISPNEDMETGDDELEAAIDAADIQYVGVATDVNAVSGPTMTDNGYNPMLYFGITTYRDWATSNSVMFDIYIDVDQDGEEDFDLWNYSYGSYYSGDASDQLYSFLYDLNYGYLYIEDYINHYSPDTIDTVLYNTNMIIIPVSLDSLGLSTDSVFDFYVVSTSYDYPDIVDMTSVYTYDLSSMAIDTGYDGFPMYDDNADTIISAVVDETSRSINGNSILLMHHHNYEDRAEVVNVFPVEIYMPVLMNSQ